MVHESIRGFVDPGVQAIASALEAEPPRNFGSGRSEYVVEKFDWADPRLVGWLPTEWGVSPGARQMFFVVRHQEEIVGAFYPRDRMFCNLTSFHEMLNMGSAITQDSKYNFPHFIAAVKEEHAVPAFQAILQRVRDVSSRHNEHGFSVCAENLPEKAFQEGVRQGGESLDGNRIIAFRLR